MMNLYSFKCHNIKVITFEPGNIFELTWYSEWPLLIQLYYSIVKDSSADLGVNSKIVQIRPTVKAVCTKISKNFFCIFVNIFVFLRENKEVSFFIF